MLADVFIRGISLFVVNLIPYETKKELGCPSDPKH